LSRRILQFGTTGQVAREMLARAGAHGVALTAMGRAEADLTDTAAVEAAIAGAQADLVVNAAAYTAVDRAEQEPDLAMAVNATAPGVMARACARRGLALIHLSTDYVFDGDRAGAYAEDDPPAPRTAYGRSKLAGEAAVLEALDQALVVRTSWVFSPYGTNFVKTMLRLGRERGEVGVVDDQTGRPTAAGSLAQFILANAATLAKSPDRRGLLHFAGRGPVTWRDFAEAIFERSGIEPRPRARAITTADYPTPARRPRNSTLDTSRLEQVFAIEPPLWRAGLDETLAQLNGGVGTGP